MWRTPFAGANRSRFKGLRPLRTLSALCQALPCRCFPAYALAMISPRSDPDRALVIRIVTEARRLARGQGRMKKAVRQLESIGEGRTDLLTKAAASLLHNVLVDPRTQHRTDLLAVGLLVVAGADPEQFRAPRD